MSLGRRFLTTGGVVPFTGTYSVDYLVIGGGGGGNSGGGGGGAGGYRNSFNNETSGANSSSLTARNMTVGDNVNYIIQIGAGGAGGANSGDTATMNAQGTKGGETSFHISGFSFQVYGSGGGCGGYAASSPISKNNGGCGGGGVFATGQGGSGIALQGKDGSDGSLSSVQYSGSGGGASEGSSGARRNGFAGLDSSITGSSVGRAGGGSGGQWGSQQSTGQDGGGNGQTNGTPNTGGGGGGGGRDGSSQSSGFRATGAGASGVIILRMPTAAYLTASTSGSPTVTTDGTDTILIYTGSGSYTS